MRGVRLIGIDSVEASLDKKTQVWEKIANEFKINTLNELVDEISLDEIQQAYQKILQAKQWEDTWLSFNNIECDTVLMLPHNLQTDPDQDLVQSGLCLAYLISVKLSPQ